MTHCIGIGAGRAASGQDPQSLADLRLDPPIDGSIEEVDVGSLLIEAAVTLDGMVDTVRRATDLLRAFGGASPPR